MPCQKCQTTPCICSDFKKQFKPEVKPLEDGKTTGVSYSTWYLRPPGEWEAFLKEERRKFWNRVVFPKKDYVIKDPISTKNGLIIILNHALTLFIVLLLIAIYALKLWKIFI